MADDGPVLPFRTITSGSPTSDLWIVGEAPDIDEISEGTPFVGASGYLLSKMCLEAGIDRQRAFITNVCHERPPNNEIAEWFYTKTEARARGITEVDGRYPDLRIVAGRSHLLALLDRHQPKLIITLDNTALWALTGLWGISRWRGSTIPATNAQGTPKIVATIHPAAVLREWPLRRIVVQDLRRAAREQYHAEIRKPAWNFILRPTIDEALTTLQSIKQMLRKGTVPLVCDIETRAGHIACVGIAWSKLDAICIPFMHTGGDHSYWSSEEEFLITLNLRGVLTDPRAHVIFQNGAYDLQYFSKEWGYAPNFSDDTMLMQHVAFPVLRKGLDFLSSMYCGYHRYWKDDGKHWDPALGELSSWLYNCEDCVRTFECWEVLTQVLAGQGLEAQYQFQIRRLAPVAIRMMLRGFLVDPARRAAIRDELEAFIERSNEWLQIVLGHPINVASPLQMKQMFYGDLQIPPIINRKTKAVTLDNEALEKIERRNPLLHPLFSVIRGMRSARTLLGNVMHKNISPDDRSRSTLNVAGAKTFRWSSAEDAFGDGFNQQTMTLGNENKEADHSTLIIPNFRKMFIPDPGYVLFEVDQKGADARTVAWEADAPKLKVLFRSGVDVHAANAETLWPKGNKLPDYKLPALAPFRFRAKTFTHAVNYGGKAATVAEHINVSVGEAQRALNIWFGEHPEILEWHRRTDRQLREGRTINNAFGFRINFFDRPEGMLPEALAWIGQSTTACITNQMLAQLAEQVPEAEILLQGHDSVIFQVRKTDLTDALRARLRTALTVTVPYPDPFDMPFEAKCSDMSWGNCQECTL